MNLEKLKKIFRKEKDMGKAKYTRDKQGYYSTNVWDGTFDEYGRKHYKRIRSRKSSADLEKMVTDFSALVKTGKVSRKTDSNIWKNKLIIKLSKVLLFLIRWTKLLLFWLLARKNTQFTKSI